MMIIRAVIALCLFILMWNYSNAQKHNVFIKGGIVAVDGPISIEGKDNVGPNFELGYSFSITNWLRLGLNHGYARFNTFPKAFKATQEQVNGVNPEMDAYIRSLDMSDAMFLGYSRSNFFYLSPNVECFILQVKGIRLGLHAGLVFQRNSQVSFFLDEFTLENDRVVEYTPQYMFVENLDFGYCLGVTLEEKINENLSIIVDGKFHSVDLSVNPSFGHDLFGVLRLGFIKHF
ncbi:MAG: hypothetical protein RIC35_02220 [Marinoscillum sp.]